MKAKNLQIFVNYTDKSSGFGSWFMECGGRSEKIADITGNYGKNKVYKTLKTTAKIKEIKNLEDFYKTIPEKVRKQPIDEFEIESPFGYAEKPLFENLEEAMDYVREAMQSGERMLDYKGQPIRRNSLMEGYDKGMQFIQDYAANLAKKEGYDGIKWTNEIYDYADIQLNVWNTSAFN